MLRAVKPETQPEVAFSDFWCLQVKKVGKFETGLEWAKLSAEDQVAAVVGYAAWRPTYLKEDPRFLLHPCRWIKYRRFEDELPPDARPSHASHMPMATGPIGSVITQRSVIPAHVVEQIARIKAGKC